MEADLKLVPAKCGCEGCFYEKALDCPGYDGINPPQKACTTEEGAMIFINPSEDGNKEQDDE